MRPHRFREPIHDVLHDPLPIRGRRQVRVRLDAPRLAPAVLRPPVRTTSAVYTGTPASCA
jgi:hypothetical protein